jgi:type II restriction/modification system DNA methylase subunit YeeA
MTPHEFIAKWRSGGDERRDAQPFFEDLCRLLGHPTPREADPDHTWFTYEYGASKTSGGEGWADVWKKGCFGWEAKGTHKSLERAYEQLKMYADALQNPPLLVVSDLRSIVIHTNFTNTVKREIRIEVEELADFDKRQILDAVFRNPEALRPGVTRSSITEEAAKKFATLAEALRGRGHDTHVVAHFLNRLLFCMFAEDIGLLPEKLFTKLVERSQTDADLFEQRSRQLFAAMNAGGDVAFENIEWFNGGLFDDDATLRLQPEELKLLADAARLDWSEIDPSIFGTLFERGLDPNKRSQLGAHYTDPETIMKIVRPVIVEPWLREWENEKTALVAALEKGKAAKSVPKAAQNRFNAFLERLRAFTVLDPACGSGNFLFLALRALKDIEHRVLVEGEMLGLGRQFPAIGPACVKGIELNAYAAELARITIWIGEIQWMVQNGYGVKRNPILQPLDRIECRDALLNADGSEAAWPQADVVIGNPPFIGDKKMVGELGPDYTATLRRTYAGRVPGGADFVCYWFEKANDAIRAGTLQRAGLVATNSIRGGKNREVLKHIVETSRIFEAWSDESWVNEGAAVRVSIVCFGSNSKQAHLDGAVVSEIHSDLTPRIDELGVDLTR